MLYTAFQTQEDLLTAWRAFAAMSGRALRELPEPMRGSPLVRAGLAVADMAPLATLTHERRPFGIESVKVGRRMVAVHEENVTATPFATLLHFVKDTTIEQPKVLIVAPLSGHFATLLRDTVRTMLREHDVYITDWHNAREIPLSDGVFGITEFTTHLIDFLHVLGPDSHLLAVCQPAVQALAATALMAANDDPCRPHSVTLMAGPVDARQSPTSVNRLATDHPLEWFERNLIATVPPRFPGAGRRVYPGFMQVTAFVAMNPNRHVNAFQSLFTDRLRGEDVTAARTDEFYLEYFAVIDMTAEFYLETIRSVFQDFELARGEMYWKGQLVDPGAIHDTTLLTVEGARDDICGVGQTAAAHDLACNLPANRHFHRLQPGAGHYGVFSGSRWEREIYPAVRNAILSAAQQPRPRSTPKLQDAAVA